MRGFVATVVLVVAIFGGGVIGAETSGVHHGIVNIVPARGAPSIGWLFLILSAWLIGALIGSGWRWVSRRASGASVSDGAHRPDPDA